MSPLAIAALVVWWGSFAAVAWATYRLGYKRGAALTPNDHVLRDVARQRDAMMRERDQANAAANNMAAHAMSLEAELFRMRVRQANGRLN